MSQVTELSGRLVLSHEATALRPKVSHSKWIAGFLKAVVGSRRRSVGTALLDQVSVGSVLVSNVQSSIPRYAAEQYQPA